MTASLGRNIKSVLICGAARVRRALPESSRLIRQLLSLCNSNGSMASWRQFPFKNTRPEAYAPTFLHRPIPHDSNLALAVARVKTGTSAISYYFAERSARLVCWFCLDFLLRVTLCLTRYIESGYIEGHVDFKTNKGTDCRLPKEYCPGIPLFRTTVTLSINVSPPKPSSFRWVSGRALPDEVLPPSCPFYSTYWWFGSLKTLGWIIVARVRYPRFVDWASSQHGVSCCEVRWRASTEPVQEYEMTPRSPNDCQEQSI